MKTIFGPTRMAMLLQEVQNIRYKGIDLRQMQYLKSPALPCNASKQRDELARSGSPSVYGAYPATWVLLLNVSRHQSGSCSLAAQYVITSVDDEKRVSVPSNVWMMNWKKPNYAWKWKCRAKWPMRLRMLPPACRT
ncbi:MAG: hypothetical protein H6661_00480 [Ardenticatenaceae bacterium]|nr:hypothetical protein [Ardenticatenaceae bacterium]